MRQSLASDKRSVSDVFYAAQVDILQSLAEGKRLVPYVCHRAACEDDPGQPAAASRKRSFPDPYNGLWDSIDAAFPLGAVEQLRPVLIKDYTLLRGKPFVSGLKCDRDIF